MKKETKMLFPLNLQYFADGDGNNDNDQNNNQNDQNGNQNNNQNDNNSNSNANNQNNSNEKTFTQEQVNSMMAKEKNEGKRSVLKNLGFKSEEDAKKAIELYNALVNSQKSDEEKKEEELKKANEEKDSYFNRAEEAENKLSCFQAGVDKDSIDDVLAIAKTKITESKDLDKVLEEMKKETRYASFFVSSQQKKGTGNDPAHSGGSGSFDAGNYGKSLAERNSVQNKSEKKSSFF